MAIDRKSALAGLAQKLPTENQQALKNLQSAQRVQVRQQLAAAQPGQMTTRAVQPLAAASTQQQGQAMVQQAQRGLQQQQAMGQMALAQQQQTQQADLFQRQQRMQAQANANANKLAAMSEEAKTKVLDSRLQFSAAEAQRGFMNTQQLLDWKALSAQNEIEYQDAVQYMNQQSQRKLEVMRVINAKIKQALDQEYAFKGQQLDQANRQKLYEMQRDYEEMIAAEQRDAANRTAVGSGIGTIAGTVIGAYFGGPGGAAAGGKAGGSLGGGVAAQEG